MPPTEEPLFKRAAGGMRYLLKHPYLRVSLACSATVNFFSFISFALLILFASRNLDLDAGTIGLALGIGATGGLLGAALARPLAERIGAGRLIAIAAVVFPAALGVVAFAGGPVWVRVGILAIGEFISSFAVMCYDIPLVSLQAKVIHDPMRSRVSGAFTTVNYGIRPLGAVIGGLLGSWIGTRETLIVAAIGGALSVLWLIGSPIVRTRSIDDVEPPEVGAPAPGEPPAIIGALPPAPGVPSLGDEPAPSALQADKYNVGRPVKRANGHSLARVLARSIFRSPSSPQRCCDPNSSVCDVCISTHDACVHR